MATGLAVTPTPEMTGAPDPTPLPIQSPAPSPAACADGLDNDDDTKIDSADPGCVNSADTSESDVCTSSFPLYSGIERPPGAFARTSDSPLVIGKAVMIYEGDLHLPRVFNGVQEYGVLPQVGLENMQFHLDTLYENLPYRIPNANYDGIVIIDLESWSVGNLGFNGLYRFLTENRVRANHPFYSDAEITAAARDEWAQASMDFMLIVIDAIRQRYPYAKIGMYAYPRRYHYEYGYQGVHGARYRGYNDEMALLWQSLDILSPEIYLWLPAGARYSGGYIQTTEDNAFPIRDAIAEAKRLALNYNPNLRIVPIATYRFHDASVGYGAQFLPDPELLVELFEPSVAGADGVYVWGNETEELNGSFSDFFTGRFAQFLKAQCGPRAQR